MAEREQFSYTAVTDAQGEVALRPLLSISLSRGIQSIQAIGLIDTGSDVNILPFSLGLALGVVWEEQKPLAMVSGNLGHYEARGVVLTAQVGSFPPVRMVMA